MIKEKAKAVLCKNQPRETQLLLLGVAPRYTPTYLTNNILMQNKFHFPEIIRNVIY